MWVAKQIARCRGGGGTPRTLNRITSKFRGVTHHCRTGRFEAHIWDSGKQVYLGELPSAILAAFLPGRRE